MKGRVSVGHWLKELFRDKRTREERRAEFRGTLITYGGIAAGALIIALIGVDNLLYVAGGVIAIAWYALSSKFALGLGAGLLAWGILRPIGQYFTRLAADVRWIRARLEQQDRDSDK